MIRVLVAASLLVTLAACQHAGNEPHRDRRAELPVEHPLNGTWHQDGKGDMTNTVVFNAQPLDRYWQVRAGSYSGEMLDGHDVIDMQFEWDGFNSYWHPEPQHGYTGTVELTYLERRRSGHPGHVNYTEYCTFAVADDGMSVTFGEGCEIFEGTFTKGM